MFSVTGMRARLRQVLRRADAERRMDEEIAFHLEMETERHLRLGVGPAEARRRAVLAFGGVERHKEALRDGRRIPLLEELWRDVRLAARALARTPAFAAVAVLTLALGVGANAAVFGLVSATMLRPLPFPEPERLVTLYQRYDAPGREPRPSRWSYPEFAALASTLTAVSHLAAYFADDVNLSTGVGEPMRVRAEMVTASYLPALGVRPSLGRGFLAHEDSAPGVHPVAVIGAGLWARAFGADSQVVGRRVLLNGVPLVVVGVMPGGFEGLSGGADVWIPQAMAPAVYYAEQLTSGQHFVSVVGRLRPHADVGAARAELAAAGAHAVAAVHDAADDGTGRWTPELIPLDDARRDPAAVRAHLVLAGAVLFVLLIAAVNLSGLLLARTVGRSREMAVRTALGAGRRRVVQQAVVESGIVGVLGGALGAALAAGALALLATLASPRDGVARATFAQLDSFATPAVDWRLVAFAGGLALAAGLLAGLIPALRVTRGDLTRSLRTGARGSTVGVGTLRRPTLLSGVAVAQVAFALVLLVGAGVLLQGFQRLRSLDSGMDARDVVSFRLSPPDGRYRGEAAATLLEQVLARVERVPGVAAATVGRCLPTLDCSSTPLYVPGRAEADAPIVGRHYVGPDHFRTLGIPLRRGRALSATDRAGQPRVAVVNETAARRFWPGEDPIGKRVWFGSGGGFASPDSLTEIVGVVADVRYGAPGDEVGPDFYTSYLQFTWPETMVMVRAAGDALALVPALRRAVAAVDPDLPIFDVRTVDGRAADAIADERLATAALGAFAGLGMALAALGVYGVMMYSVLQRRRELGIRLALGSTPAEVQRLVIGHGLTLAGVGLAVGLLLSLALTRALAALVAGTGTADPLVLAIVVAVLLLVALVTCYLPARAAARVDPVRTLAAD